MKKLILLLVALCVTASASANVRIYVEDVNGMAAIKYATNGEHVRAFALNVQTDVGFITNISNFHRGESTAKARGYGIFPASFAAVIDVNEMTGEVDNWDIKDYTPLADPCDAPEDTLLGLGTPGVTLEMGALYSPPTDDSPNAPLTSGLLCMLAISDKATVTVTTNVIRGGIVLTNPTTIAKVNLDNASAMIDPGNKP